MLLSIIVASGIVYFEARKKGMDKEEFIDMVFYGVIIGIVGARVYYVIFNASYYIQDPLEIFRTWHGGMAIHGALISTFIFLYFYTKKKKWNLLLLLDILHALFAHTFP